MRDEGDDSHDHPPEIRPLDRSPTGSTGMMRVGGYDFYDGCGFRQDVQSEAGEYNGSGSWVVGRSFRGFTPGVVEETPAGHVDGIASARRVASGFPSDDRRGGVRVNGQDQRQQQTGADVDEGAWRREGLCSSSPQVQTRRLVKVSRRCPARHGNRENKSVHVQPQKNKIKNRTKKSVLRQECVRTVCTLLLYEKIVPVSVYHQIILLIPFTYLCASFFCVCVCCAAIAIRASGD